MEPEQIFWLVALVVFGIAEAATVSVVSLWFMGGALAALFASVLGASLGFQAALFLLVSIVLLACLRPFVKKYVAPRRTRTNADRILGEKGMVTQEIDNLKATGAVKIDGVEWTARSQNDQVIPRGQVVRILKIEGVKIYVEPVTEPAGKGE